jgi:hypothetical protein
MSKESKGLEVRRERALKLVHAALESRGYTGPCRLVPVADQLARLAKSAPPRTTEDRWGLVIAAAVEFFKLTAGAKAFLEHQRQELSQ